MSFLKKLKNVSTENDSHLCVGLDPDLELLPSCLKKEAESIFLFNKAIVEATKDIVAAYKPNIAFYEAAGIKGWEALYKTLDLIPDHIPVILDAKRGDIGNTSAMYARACFEELGVDAVTIHGYMGSDTVKPFLKYQDRAIFVLVKTSNPSAGEIEDLLVESSGERRTVAEVMASLVAEWNLQSKMEVGAVVGATYPEDIRIIRSILPDETLLIPGVGSQGGDLESTLSVLKQWPNSPFLINVSRLVLYASSDEDYASQARFVATSLRDRINSYLRRAN